MVSDSTLKSAVSNVWALGARFAWTYQTTLHAPLQGGAFFLDAEHTRALRLGGAPALFWVPVHAPHCAMPIALFWHPRTTLNFLL